MPPIRHQPGGQKIYVPPPRQGPSWVADRWIDRNRVLTLSVSAGIVLLVVVIVIAVGSTQQTPQGKAQSTPTATYVPLAAHSRPTATHVRALTTSEPAPATSTAVASKTPTLPVPRIPSLADAPPHVVRAAPIPSSTPRPIAQSSTVRM